MVILLKFVLALCGICYEMLLAQTLSVFLDNTVLRYATTIGVYMFAMGAGALASVRIARGAEAGALWGTEVLLTLAGPLGVVAMFVAGAPDVPFIAAALLGYGFVLLTGVLVGMELPLLLRLGGETPGGRARIIAVDYAGAFAGTLLFAFVLYPRAGLVSGVLAVAALNALAAVAAAFRWRAGFGAGAVRVLFLSLLLAVGVLLLALSGEGLQEILAGMMMKGVGRG